MKQAIEALRLANRPAVELAHVGSIAAVIEPELLRSLRLRFVPGSDASAEADLWFSPLVGARSAQGIVLDPEARDLLHADLAQRADLDAIHGVVRDAHRSLPPLVQLEERLTWMALAGASDAEIQDALGSVVVTMVRDPARAEDLSAWALRALRHQPERVRASLAAWILGIGAGARMGVDATPHLAVAPPGDLAAAAIPGLLPEGTARVSIGVRRGPGWIELGPPSPGAATIAVPETTPRFVEVSWATGSELVALRGGETARREVPAGELVLRTLAGERYALRPRRVAQGANEQRRAKPRLPPGFTWVHLSGLQGADYARYDAAGEDLRRFGAERGTGVDVAFVAGDLTRSGDEVDLDIADRGLQRMVGSALQVPIFAVPGNHDLERIVAPDLNLVRRWHEDEPLRDELFDERSKLRELVERSFASWRRWMRRFPLPRFVERREGVLPGDFAASMSLRGVRVGVIGLNSEVLAVVGAQRGWLDLDVRQLEAVCAGDPDEWAAIHDLTILLTHRPPEGLSERARRRFEEIAPPGRFDLHLHGTTHGIAPRGTGRSVTLQYGARAFGGARDRVERGYTIGKISDARLDGEPGGRHVWIIPRSWSAQLATFAGAQPEIESRLGDRVRRSRLPPLRACERRALELLRGGKSCFLYGARQLGKSWFLHGVIGLAMPAIEIGRARDGSLRWRPLGEGQGDLRPLPLESAASQAANDRQLAGFLRAAIQEHGRPGRRPSLVVAVDDWHELPATVRQNLARAFASARVSSCVASEHPDDPHREARSVDAEPVLFEDFTLDETRRLLGLGFGEVGQSPDELLRAIHAWSSGDPVVTRILMDGVRREPPRRDESPDDRVARVAARTARTATKQPLDDLEALAVYRRILDGEEVQRDASRAQGELLRLGIVKEHARVEQSWAEAAHAEFELRYLVSRSRWHAAAYGRTWIDAHTIGAGGLEPRAWVLVAGLSDADAPREILDAAIEVGHALARRGYGLVTRALPGVYAAVQDGFAPKGLPRLRSAGSRRESVELAQVVVLLPGGERTEDILGAAREARIPVLPLAWLGGTAAEAGRMIEEQRQNVDEVMEGIARDDLLAGVRSGDVEGVMDLLDRMFPAATAK